MQAWGEEPTGRAEGLVHSTCLTASSPRKGKKTTRGGKDTRLTRRPSKHCMSQGAPRSVVWRNEVIKAKNEYA